MPKKGERANKDLPPEMLASVRDHLVRAMLANKWTNRDACAALGIDIATLSKIANAKGSVGVRTLLKLRNGLNVTMDALLGLPPLTPAGELRQLLTAALDQLARDDRPAPSTEAPRDLVEDPLAKRVADRKKSRGRQNPAQS